MTYWVVVSEQYITEIQRVLYTSVSLTEMWPAEWEQDLLQNDYGSLDYNSQEEGR